MTQNEYDDLQEQLEHAQMELIEAESELHYAEEEAMSCDNWQQECFNAVAKLERQLDNAVIEDELDPAGDADDLHEEDD